MKLSIETYARMKNSGDLQSPVSMFSRDNAFFLYVAMQKLEKRIMPGISEIEAKRLNERYTALSNRLKQITPTEVGNTDAKATVQ